MGGSPTYARPGAKARFTQRVLLDQHRLEAFLPFEGPVLSRMMCLWVRWWGTWWARRQCGHMHPSAFPTFKPTPSHATGHGRYQPTQPDCSRPKPSPAHPRHLTGSIRSFPVLRIQPAAAPFETRIFRDDSMPSSSSLCVCCGGVSLCD